MSLAGQFLVLQLLIVLAVLVAVVAISMAQSAAAFERIEGRRRDLGGRSAGRQPRWSGSCCRRRRTAGGARAWPPWPSPSAPCPGHRTWPWPGLDGTVVASSDPGVRRASRWNSARAGCWRARLDRRGRTATATRYCRAHVPGPGRLRRDDRHRLRQPELPVHVWSGWATPYPTCSPTSAWPASWASAGSLLLARRVKRQTLGHGADRDRRPGRAPRGDAARHSRKAWSRWTPQERITVVNDSARAAAAACRRTAWARTWTSLAVEPRAARGAHRRPAGPGPAGAGGRPGAGAQPDARCARSGR